MGLQPCRMLINSTKTQVVYRLDARYNWKTNHTASLGVHLYLREKYRRCHRKQCRLESPGGSYFCFLHREHEGAHAATASQYPGHLLVWGEDLWDDITAMRLLGV